MISNKIQRNISLLLLVLFVGFCFWLLYKHYNALIDYFYALNWHHFVLICIAHTAFVALGGLAFAKLCQVKNYHTKWYEWLGLSFFANFFNQLLPYRPGLVIRYAYLKRNYHISLKDYLNINFIFFIFITLAALLFFLFGFMYIPTEIKNKFVQFNISATSLFWGFIILLFTAATVLYIYTVYHNTQNRHFWHNLKRMFFSENILSFFSIILMQLFLTLGFYLCFYSLNIQLPFFEVVCISGAVSLSMILPITPGNLGIIEWLMGTLTLWWYDDFTLGLATALIYRAALLISASIGCCIFFLVLADKIPNKEQFKNWNKQVR